MISALVCADRSWAIGNGGSRLIVIPEDRKYLNAAAIGNTLIMGRKTFESFSEYELPLDCRKIVLSRSGALKYKDADVADSPQEALRLAKKYPGNIYVIGGAQCFAGMLPYCEEIEVTYVEYRYEADVYFPNLDKMPEWVMVSESEEQTYFDTVFYFRKYARRKEYRP